MMKRIIFFINLVYYILLVNFAQAADVYIPKSKITDDSIATYYIISIGINNYLDSYWQTLKWPASDATRVADKLGVNTDVKRVTQLIINETATLENINKSLLDVSQLAGPNDTVILYISGHGTLAQTASGELERVFLMHDSNQNDLFSTALPFSTLQRWLDKLHSRKNLMILATCHSGEGKSRLPASVQQILSERKGKLIALSDVSEGALILTAAANGEAARENDKLQGDIYTYYLLEALELYDRNKDGVISALEAHDYARDRTWVFTNGRQRPTANVKLIGDADIALVGTKIGEGLPVLEAYANNMSGFFVKVDGKVKGRLPSAFSLDPKGSKVELYSPSSRRPIARYFVSADAGQRVNLQHIMNHRPIRFESSIVKQYWQDPFWGSLTGSSTTNTLEVSTSLYMGPFGFGFIFDAPISKTHQYSNFIESDIKLRSKFIMAEYRMHRFRWSFITRLELGQEKLSIKLSDTSNSSSPLSFADSSVSTGISFSADFRVGKDFYVTSTLGFRKTDWELGSFKNISGQRRWFRIGINYQFGWLSRTI